jgi:hypothetical protein
MKKKEFNAVIASISVKGALSPTKAKALPSETRSQLTNYIVRNRGPVAACLLPDDVAAQDSWLNAMGYMYHSVSARNGLTFRHTCEHRIS